MKPLLQFCLLFYIFTLLPFAAYGQSTVVNGASRFGFATPSTNYTHSFQALSLNEVKAPVNGVASWVKQGTLVNLTYTPNANFIGRDTFVLQSQQTGPGYPFVYYQYIIDVANTHVLSNTDYFALQVNETKWLDVLSNDQSLPYNLPLHVGEVLYAKGGTASLSDNGVTFQPEADYTGKAFVAFTVCTEDNVCKTEWAYIRTDNITASSTETIYTTLGKRVLLTSPKGFSLSVTPEHGTLIAINENAYEFVPATTYTGNDEVVFECMSGNEVQTYTVTITVLNTPVDNKYALTDYAFVQKGANVTLDLLGNDVGDLQIGSVLASSVGTITISEDNKSATYVAPASTTVNETAISYQVLPNGLPITANVPNEWGKVQLKISNRLPNLTEYKIPVLSGQQNIVELKDAPDDVTIGIQGQTQFGSLVWFPGVQTIQFNGETIEGKNLLVYTPAPGATQDYAVIEQCVNNECSNYTLEFVVNNETTNLTGGINAIWPGDANADGIVNNIDLLSLGAAFGKMGEARPNANATFISQKPGALWADKQAQTGINLQHADSDGNGRLDINDISAIEHNYGTTHAVTATDRYFKQEIPLFFKFNDASPAPGDTVTITVELGSAITPAYGVNGLAFRMLFDQAMIKPGSLVFIPSNQNSFSDAPLGIVTNAQEGVFDVSVTRFLNKPSAGFGSVGVVKFIVDDIIDGFKSEGISFDIPVNFEQVHHTNVEGQIFMSGERSLSIPLNLSSYTNNAASREAFFVLMPNPSSDYMLARSLDLHLIRGYRIMDISGREIQSNYDLAPDREIFIQHELPQGTYILQLYTDGATASKTFLVMR